MTIRTEWSCSDTEVDSIRAFDSLTQRSIEALSDISVYPCSHIAKDHEVFEAAGKRITRAYDRRIKALEKKEGSSETVYNLKQRKQQASGIHGEHDKPAVHGKVHKLFL